MKFDFVIVADAATEAGGKLNILGAGITRLTPPRVPWREPALTFVVRALVEPDDLGQDHRITVSVVEPGGSFLVPPMKTEIPAAELLKTAERAADEEARGVQLIATLAGPVFRQAGVYEVVVEIDGAEVRRYPLPVTPTPSYKTERRG
jgi:hypothetical protein